MYGAIVANRMPPTTAGATTLLPWCGVGPSLMYRLPCGSLCEQCIHRCLLDTLCLGLDAELGKPLLHAGMPNSVALRQSTQRPASIYECSKDNLLAAPIDLIF